MVIGNLKRNKVAGKDNCVFEGIKFKMIAPMYALTCMVQNSEQTPNRWKVGLICLIFFLKIDKEQCGGRTRLQALYKILSKIILRRLEVYTERTLQDCRNGFHGRSSMDQIFTQSSVNEKILRIYSIMDLHSLLQSKNNILIM